MTATHDALRVHDLGVFACRSGTAILEGVSFQARRGEAIGIIGDSGAGKSTLALALMGLLPTGLRRSATSAWWLGETALHDLAAPDWRAVRGRRIAMVFQEPVLALDPAMRVGAQVIEAGTVHGRTAAEAARRALELFAQLGLPAPAQLATRYPHELSGGMRQRILLAMAMLHRPEVVIADEATTALDPPLRRTVLDALDALRRDHGTTLLLISHDHAEVAVRCDRILTVTAGRLAKQGLRPRAVAVVGAPTTPPAPASAPLLLVRDLVVDYARASIVHDPTAVTRAVDGLSLTIDRGEVLGLIGPSGAGKSSVARAILRLTPVTSGRIAFEGMDLLTLEGGALRRLRRGLQWIPQDAGAALTPQLRVDALVAEGLEVHGLARGGAARRQAQQLLDEVGLPTRVATARPADLSTGERQRVAIARALAPRPDLLVCDEPVANLDPARRARILELLATLQRTRGLAILLISHDASAVERLASRVLSMYLGRSGVPHAP